jgi:hypothetical protein
MASAKMLFAVEKHQFTPETSTQHAGRKDSFLEVSSLEFKFDEFLSFEFIFERIEMEGQSRSGYFLRLLPQFSLD